MPDISMCGNDACPSKALCYRHEASGTRPSPHWQSYSAFKPDGDGTMCIYFWAAPTASSETTARVALGAGNEEAERG